jgi:electron transfer flavoprotein beta subunit
MNVLVLLSGIADPKWPLPASLDAPALANARADHPLLSPFDEAALQLALKLRDADPAVRITAGVVTGSRIDALLRSVASFRLDRTLALDTSGLPAWDAAALAKAVAAGVRQLDPPVQLVLVGREFGDADDGTAPAAIAEALGMAYASLVLAIAADGAGVELVRQQGAGQERWGMPLPVVISVTNDARNKLRHPLLKNVMAAKKMSFDLADLPSAGVVSHVQLQALDVAKPAVRATRCRMLAGDVPAQAAALAELLLRGGAR